MQTLIRQFSVTPSIVLLGFSIALFALSLALPAYLSIVSYAQGGPSYGVMAFLLGPVGLIGGHFSWLANVSLWLSWHAIVKRQKVSAVCWAGLSILVAGTFMFHETIPGGSSGSFPYKILIGYYVWVAGMGAALWASIFVRTPVRDEGAVSDLP